ncbi:MAG: hypothetical protein H6719_05590 [Sandaracinaceae bacterium]|nr:hypothetical protein [Sandaracinaceae bacterium]
MMWKPICAELARRPPSEEATQRLLDSSLPGWLLSPILAASPHPIGYTGLRRLALARHGDARHANTAVRGMARADPKRAFEELSEWLADPSKDIRGIATVGLAALGTDEAARQIADAAAAGHVSPLLAGQELGWMAAEGLTVVSELLAADDEVCWRVGVEAAVARWRAAPHDPLVHRWRPLVSASLSTRQPTGLLGRWLNKWVSGE